MQTALHILSLEGELRGLVGGTVVSTEFYKKERVAYMFIKQGKSRYAFGFVYHPHGFGLFVVPASKIRLDTREKPWPYFGLEGAVLQNVEQVAFDRILRLTFLRDDTEISIVCEAMGVNGNLWLVDNNNRRKATLRKRTFKPESIYDPPSPPVGLHPEQLTAEDIEDLAGKHEKKPFGFVLEKNVLGLNRTLAAEVIKRACVDGNDRSPNAFAAIARSVHDLAERFRDADAGYLYHIGGKIEVYPLRLSTVEDAPEKFKLLSLAVLQMCMTRQSQVEEADERKTLQQAAVRMIRKLGRRFKNIDSDITEAADFEENRRRAELLQINYDHLRRGMNEITVEDVYTDSNEMVTITLDPALLPSENIERYFRKYRKGREGLALLQRRLEITQQELAGWEEISVELENDFETARERYATELATQLPRSSVSQIEAPRLPFKRYTLSTGLTLLVGRDGADNDRTTFEYARPYEMWFHAQQCAGSHVVIKYPNKSFEPSKQEIAEAAAISAWYSKARNDSLVPVIYTQRRYVRKPRKAKPGLVTVEREKSVMVAPRKPES